MTDPIMKINYTLPPEFDFSWCSAFGEDRKGIWIEFTVRYGDEKKKKVKQRMRWINPGCFTMGSTGEKIEGGEDQVPHEVNLSKGFWLADTACTQELWEAVMGGNPSRFKGPQRPVEMVSWDDCQLFLKKINLMPDLAGIDLCLPTEAQWEYACRAGTTTPFSFGENITLEQANYKGNYPYADGAEGLYREETIDVKTFKPNNWGLYEMHGNVYEWCNDWYDNYPSGSVTDPKGSESGAYSARVLRGGSWLSNGNLLQAAYRWLEDPSNSHDYIGFRLSRG